MPDHGDAHGAGDAGIGDTTTRPDGTITYNGPAGNRKPRSNLTDDDPDDHH